MWDEVLLWAIAGFGYALGEALGVKAAKALWVRLFPPETEEEAEPKAKPRRKRARDTR